jgi:hypothetical protein
MTRPHTSHSELRVLYDFPGCIYGTKLAKDQVVPKMLTY